MAAKKFSIGGHCVSAGALGVCAWGAKWSTKSALCRCVGQLFLSLIVV